MIGKSARRARRFVQADRFGRKWAFVRVGHDGHLERQGVDGVFKRQGGLNRQVIHQTGQSRGLSIDLGKHGQLIEGRQTQIVQKLARRGIQPGPTNGLTVADDFDPTPVFELLEDLRVDGDATDVFHVAPRHWLTVGNDGQGFQHGAGVLGRLFGVQAIEVSAQLGTTLKSPAAGHADELQTLLSPFILQVLQHLPQGVGPERIVKKHAHVAQ